MITKVLANTLQIVFFAALFTLLMLPDVATAQGTNLNRFGGNSAVFNEVDAAIDTGFTNARRIVYGIAGLAAIALGVMAMMGRFAWSKFFGIIAGIGVIALIDLALQFLIGQNDAFNNVRNG